MTRNISVVDLGDARTVIDAAIARSVEIQTPVFVVVVNAVGQTVASARADGSNYFSERIAVGKALTAIGMGVSTETWETLSASDAGFAGGITSVRDFTPFSGGVPLVVDGALVGAVGVSGGTPAQDIDIAEVAASALASAQL